MIKRNLSCKVALIFSVFVMLLVCLQTSSVPVGASSSPSVTLPVPKGLNHAGNQNYHDGYKKAKSNGWITGCVTDAVTDAVLPNVQIAVHARIVDTLPGGTLVMMPMEETIPLGIPSYTNSKGKFKVKVPLGEDAHYFKVCVHADGYQEQQNMLVRVERLKRSVVNFQLIKDEPTPQETEIVDQKHELQKMNLLEKTPSFIQTLDTTKEDESEKPSLDQTGKEGSFFYQQTYPVPDQVYVLSLNGFTGYMSLDDFISGVISAELGASFPYETLKAQAVASRSYALERYNRTGAANGGQAYTSTINDTCRTATVNTSKIVILSGGNVVSAYFSARCNGDSTLNSEDGVWHKTGTCSVGGNYVAYARSKPCSGHDKCNVKTETPCCNVMTGGRNVYIYGHGVGMCQRGTEQFACRDGKDWYQILTGYYTGITIANMPSLDVGDRIVATSNVNARSTPCSSNLLTVPAGTAGTVVAGPDISFCSGLGTCNGGGGAYWTWWQVNYDNGVTGRWCVENYLKKTSSGTNAQITVTTDPIVSNITVDDTTYTPPHMFSWSTGSQHTIGTPSPQYSTDQKTRYNYTSWSDAGAQTHTITVSSGATHTASFSTQYLLETAVNPSGSGSISLAPPGPWYNPNQSVQLTATAYTGYTFKDWSGDLSGSSNLAVLEMSGTKSVTANLQQTCVYTISPAGKTFSAGGGTGSVEVTAASDCSWTAVSSADWITVTSGSNGTGNGLVDYSVSANTGTSQRTGAMDIAGQAFTVTQKGIAQCKAKTITAAPNKLSLMKNGNGDVAVTVKGTGRCSVEGATVTVTISGSGNQIIAVSPASQTTDVNGQAMFAIDAKDVKGTASIRFRASGLGKSATVPVKVR